MIPPELLTWGFPLALFALCIGAAFAVLQISPPNAEEFWIARGAFVVAGIIGLARFTLFMFYSNKTFGVKFLITAAAFAAIAPTTIAAVSYVNQRHDRWLQSQQLQSRNSRRAEVDTKETKPPIDDKEKPRPNLVDKGVRRWLAHEDLHTGLLLEGAQTFRPWFDPDWDLLTIQICNEFRVQPKVSIAEDITAEIYYSLPNSTEPVKINRGAWLTGRNRISLGVNDYDHLIIACGQRKLPHKVQIFLEEYGQGWSGSRVDLDRIMGALEPDQDYPVEVQLISESNLEHYATFNYILTIASGDQNHLFVDLVEAYRWDEFKKEREKAKTQAKTQPQSNDVA